MRRHVKVGCRAMSRPWAADPFLKDCMHEFIEKQNSITKIIQYKPTFKDMYSQNRTTCFEDVAVSSRIKDLAYAPHRYHSESKALLRLVLTWDAALTTAAQVPLVRGATSPEGASMIQTISKCTAGSPLRARRQWPDPGPCPEYPGPDAADPGPDPGPRTQAQDPDPDPDPGPRPRPRPRRRRPRTQPRARPDLPRGEGGNTDPDPDPDPGPRPRPRPEPERGWEWRARAYTTQQRRDKA